MIWILLFLLPLGCAATRVTCEEGRPDVVFRTLFRPAHIAIQCASRDGMSKVAATYQPPPPQFWDWLHERGVQGLIREKREKEPPPMLIPPDPGETRGPLPPKYPPGRRMALVPWQWSQLRCGGALEPEWCH